MLRIYRYEQIADELRREITSRAIDGTRLPSERRLMSRFGVQRDTVRRALALLASEGRIVISDRRGAYLADPAYPAAIESLAGTILVVSPWNGGSTALDSLLRGLSQTLAPIPRVSVLYFDSRPRHGHTHFEMPSDDYLQVNGVIGSVVWAHSPTDLPALRRLRAAAPLVLVDRLVPGFEADSVGFDNLDGGRLVTEHLIHKGHRRIGFVGQEVFADPVQQRWRGYATALDDAGIEFDASWSALFQEVVEPAYSQQLRTLLSGQGDPLTAVVCSNDHVAMGLLQFLRQEGLRVPDDVAVTGYGDLLPNSTGALRLTTAAQPFEDVGRETGQILLNRLAHCEPPGESGPRQIELRVRLIPRASSGGEG